MTEEILEKTSPEEVGISSRHIAAYLRKLRAMDYDLHSFQIVKDGRLIFAEAAAPYTLESPHRLLSAAKAIIAAAVFFAVEEEQLSLNDNIIKYFRDKLPQEYDERFERITLYDLLTMQSGQNSDEAFLYFLEHSDIDLCASFFRTPMDCEPGTQFFYNNAIPHLLFSLVERATGRNIEEWIDEKLCRPLGIKIKAQYNAEHIYDPVTIVISARDFLKLAMWFLQMGNWRGEQLLNPELIKMACTQQTWTGNQEAGYHNGKGYCMQLWKNAFGGCRMDGGGGQIALILPEYNMTAVFMGNESRSDQAIQLFYEEILSKIHGWSLPADREGETGLLEAAENMNRAPFGVQPHAEAERMACGKKYLFPDNKWKIETLCFQFESEETVLAVRQDGKEDVFSIGLKACWHENKKPLLLAPDISIQNRIYGPDPEHCCLSGGWKTSSVFEVVCKSLASMGEYVFCFSFRKDGMELMIPGGISAGMKSDKGHTCLKSL